MKFKLIIDNTKEEEVTATVHQRTELTDSIELLVMQHTGTDRIAAYTEDDMCLLPFSRIECITILDGKTYAVDQKGTQYRLKQRLYELEESLPPSDFIRISNSEIVNIHKIRRLDTSLTGTIRMQLAGDVETYVSRRYVTKIKKSLGL